MIKEAALPALLVLAILAQHTFVRTFSGTWFGGWLVISAFSTFAVAIAARKSRAGLFAPIFAYIVMSGILVGVGGYGFPLAGGSSVPVLVHTSARLFSLSSLAAVFILVGLLLVLTDGQVRRLRGFLSDAGLLTAISIIVQAVFFGKDVSWQVWVFDNPSMAASFAVLGALSHTEWLIKSNQFYRKTKVFGAAFIWLVTASMLAMVKATTPTVAAAAGLLYILAPILQTKRVIPFGLVLAAAAIYFFPSKETLIASMSGRMELWSAMYEYWSVDAYRMLFGTGLGTSKIIMPILTGNGWFWAHSDWIQIAFELGIMGLSLAILAAGRVFYGLYRTNMGSVFVCFSVLMLGNFPVHSPAHALWIVPLIRRSL